MNSVSPSPIAAGGLAASVQRLERAAQEVAAPPPPAPPRPQAGPSETVVELDGARQNFAANLATARTSDALGRELFQLQAQNSK